MNAVCFSFPQDELFGRSLADALGVSHGDLRIHRFPDGETLVRLCSGCAGKNVIFVCSGREPDSTALPLHFAAHAARSMGASGIGLLAPYLAYMRQDAKFHDGEAVSAHAYARFLSSSFDWIVTVDPHLHRIKSLEDIFEIPAACISSMPAISDWVRGNIDNPVIIGPDAESAQWVSAVAQLVGAPWAALRKTRTGDREVSIEIPNPEAFRDHSPVIVDDIASSGRTLAEATRSLRSLTSRPVTCIVVHALLAAGAESALGAAGIGRLVSTNTVAHESNQIDVVPLVAESVRLHLRGQHGVG